MDHKINLPFDILVTDVDGVLTDGKYIYDAEGKRSKLFGPHDADGIKFLKSFGVKVLAISADKRGFPITSRRLADMGVELSQVSEHERAQFILEVSSLGRVAFVGDGYFDIQAFKVADFSYAPKNALDVVKTHADFVLPSIGGQGVLLSLFEHFLTRLDGDYHAKYLKGELSYG